MVAVHKGGIRPLTLSLYPFSFFSFSELGTEPRALRLLGKRSTTELNPQPPFSIFADGSGHPHSNPVPPPQHEPSSIRERLVAKLADATRTFVTQEKLAQAHFLVV